MQCRTFRRNIARFLDDSIGERAFENFCNHAETCDKCAYYAIYRYLQQIDHVLIHTDRFIAQSLFEMSQDENYKRATQKTKEQIARMARWRRIGHIRSTWQALRLRTVELEQIIERESDDRTVDTLRLPKTERR